MNCLCTTSMRKQNEEESYMIDYRAVLIICCTENLKLTEQLNWVLVSWIEKYKHKQLATTPEINI